MRKEQPVTDNKKDSANVALIRIAYHESDSGESTEVTLDPVVFVGLVHIMRTLGQEHARAVLQFGTALVKPELTTVDTQRLDYVLTAGRKRIKCVTATANCSNCICTTKCIYSRQR